MASLVVSQPLFCAWVVKWEFVTCKVQVCDGQSRSLRRAESGCVAATILLNIAKKTTRYKDFPYLCSSINLKDRTL